MGNYVIAGVGNYVIENPSDLGNFMIADSHRAANRNHQRRRPSNVDMGRNEPKRIEIAA